MCGMRLMRLELFGRDLVRSLRFYKDVLGFEIDETVAPPTSDYVPVRNGHVRIALCLAETLPHLHYFRPTDRTRLGVGAEIVLEVERFADYEARARKSGAVVEAAQLRPWGLWDFRVVDPDGYYIRVTEMRLPRPKHRAKSGNDDPADGASVPKASAYSQDGER
jgi:lactoylglutathione lyase